MKRLALILACLLVGPFSFAMNSNLARPFDPKPSPPNDSKIVFFSPDHDDFLFPAQKEIQIECIAGFRSIGLKWTLARNAFKQPFLTGAAEALPANRYKIHFPTAKLTPGFYDLRVELDLGNETLEPGICTFGYHAAEMPITPDRPADFTEFWNKAKQELAQVPLDPHVGDVTVFKGDAINAYNISSAALPGDFDPAGHRTEVVEACKVDFASVEGMRVHAYLAKPPGNGPFPAMLVLPGAGFAARPMPLDQARHGYIALDIQVHGQEVDLPKYPRLPGYYDNFVFDPPSAYYYRRVYLNALQALNYLESRPDVDKHRIVLAGGSQGGRLSIILAGLDTRVAAAVACIANGGNVPYNKWSKACNEAVPPLDGMDRAVPPALPDTPEGRCMGYYDIMNFAPAVRCPVLMNAGLVDPVSPPSEVFPLYHQLGTPDKSIVPLPGMGHDWSAEFDRRAWRWLDHILNLPSPQTAGR